MDVYGLGKNLCHKDNLIVHTNHIYIYRNYNVECTKCNIIGLKYRNGEIMGGLIEKLKYSSKNLVDTDALQVMKLNVIKRAWIWKAVDNYYVPKHEGEEQKKFKLEKRGHNKKLRSACKEIIDIKYDCNNCGLRLLIWQIPKMWCLMF